MPAWVILTPEYPPASGGVGDYTRQTAEALAATGDTVEVWTPPRGHHPGRASGVRAFELPDRFGPRSWRALGRALDARTDSPIVLLQYVPQGFGMRVMNVPFLLWLAQRRETVWVMIHEAVFPFKRGQPLRHHALGVVTRGMLGILGSRADRIFVSVPTWSPFLSRYSKLKSKPEWLPIPSNLPTTASRSREEIRADLGIPTSQKVLVHFGTYSPVIAAPLRATVRDLLADRPERTLLLVGRNGEKFAADIARSDPPLADQLIATGELPSQQAADALSAADLAVFPFPDGISGRRTSAMAALAIGVPILATQGTHSEPVWAESKAVETVPAGQPDQFVQRALELLEDREHLNSLGARGRSLYAATFAIERVIEVLRAATPETSAIVA